MKKLIFIISFLLAIQYETTVYATETNEIMQEQEETLGISSFLEEAENYTKEVFSDIDLNSMYKSAITGEISSKGIVNGILNILGEETLDTFKTLGYILIIIIVHSIIKSISDGLDNRRDWTNNILRTIHINCNIDYD